MLITHQQAQEIVCEAINLLGPKFLVPGIDRLMLAIAYQESGFEARKQYGNGPAKGFWQFEENGGVRGVLMHHSTAIIAQELSLKLIGSNNRKDVYWALQENDLLAACFARLLLYTDPHPIPTDMEGAWQYYLRTWRPGKPHRERWDENWEKAGQ